jgi:hypothetical protein
MVIITANGRTLPSIGDGLSGKTAQLTDRCLLSCFSQKSAGTLFAPAAPVKHCIAVFNADN